MLYNSNQSRLPFYRCIDHTYKYGPRGARRDIRDLMVDMHGENVLRDKPDCGVIDPAWCKAEGQNYPIPCESMHCIVH